MPIISDKEAADFLQFRRFQAFFEKIVKRGLRPEDLVVVNGHLEIHFNDSGIDKVYAIERRA